MSCKGRACQLQTTQEYADGLLAGLRNITKNPYNFFDHYEKHYAWCIGNQVGIKQYMIHSEIGRFV